MYTLPFCRNMTLLAKGSILRIMALLGPCVVLSCVRSSVSRVADSIADTTASSGSNKHAAKLPDMPPANDSLSRLIGELRTLGGEYSHPQYNSLAWVLSEEQAPVFSRITSFGDAAILPLVQCIGDSTPTVSRIRQRFVPLGVLCYEALNRIIYHEEPSATGDMDPDWAGDITPDATALDLRRAQRAWLKVVRAGAFQRN